MANTSKQNFNNPIVKALLVSGYHMGVENIDSAYGTFINGRFVDAYLAVLTLAERIAAGDVMLVEKDDFLKKKNYYDRLLESCKTLNVSDCLPE